MRFMELNFEFESLGSSKGMAERQVKVMLNAEFVISTDDISLEDLEEELRELLEKYSIE